MKNERAPWQGPHAQTNTTTAILQEDPLEQVLDRLDHVRRSGRGWTARCPAHEDRQASLSVAVGRDDRVLLHCFAGCTVNEITKAIGLELRDLFPPGAHAEGSRAGTTHNPRKSKPAPLPRELIELLIEAEDLPTEWVIAKHLATAPRRAMERDVARSWEYLSSLGSIPTMVKWAGLVRGVAVLRYGEARRMQDPDHVENCVNRLLRELEGVAA